MNDSEEGTTVSVTKKGQATIPKEFRDKLGIDAPGRVRFVENEHGEILIRPIERPSELRGALASGRRDGEASADEKSATKRLRAERTRDERKAEEKFGTSGSAE